MKLSIIIVSYNVKYYLEQCLCSLRRACADIESEIWVVDNNSADNTIEFIAARFPEVKIIANKTNEGFSRANNMAIRQATGDYVLLLNPDTIVGEDTLRRCLAFMDKHTQAGAVGVQMLKDDGRFAYESRRGLPSPLTSFCKMTGLCTLFPRSRWLGRYYMRYLNKNKVNRIEVVSGAFCMIRRSTLNKVGLLDEDYFMYGEDIDLSYRLLQAGYQNYYLPLRILHYKGESTQKSSFRYVHVFYKAMLIFFNKHYRSHCRWLAPIVQAAVVVRGFLDLCAQKNKRLQYKIGIKKETADKKTYLFLGRQEAITAALKLCNAKGLHADFVEATIKTLPHGHLTLSRKLTSYDYVVYDTDAYSYRQILQIMAHERGKNGLRLGTFSCSSGRLITMEKVF